MFTSQRQLPTSVIERLLAHPYRFEFFQAVRVLELSLKAQGATSDQAAADFIRFENSISLAFPPSEIERLHVEAPPSNDNHGRPTPRYVMTPAFMGFLGPSGTLPRHYSERLASHQLYHRDHGPRAFLDTFSNRAVALFYSAWKKYRLELSYESNGKNGFLPLLMSLGGLGHANLRDCLNADDIGIRDESLAYYAGALRSKPVTVNHLQNILREYFQVDAQIDQFVGKFYPLPDVHQTSLGLGNAELGASALIGQRLWQRDLRIGLTLGPLSRADFERFLPGQKAAHALEELIKLVIGLTLECEVRLVLQAQAVRGFALTDQRDTGRLGWDTFVCTQAQTTDRTDVRYTINAL